MHGRWRLGCLVGCELWLDRAGKPLPVRASLLEDFRGSSLRLSWRSVVLGQPDSSSFPSKDPSF